MATPGRQIGHRRLRRLESAGLLRSADRQGAEAHPQHFRPYQLGYSPDSKLFVATSLRLDRVDIYDPADFRLKARLHAPRTPSHMAFDAAGTTSSSRCRIPMR